MSKMEIILVVSLCIVPFLAILFVFPIKFKLKSKKSKKVEAKDPPKVVEQVPVVEEKPNITPKSNDLEDFVKFAKNRKSKLTGPTNIGPRSVTSFDQRQFAKSVPKKSTVKEEIKGLTPEAKVLIITGALAEPKYKDFDKF